MEPTKALQILSNVRSIGERANQYHKMAKEDIFLDIIKPLERKIVDIDNQIFELSDFNLETNLNKGMRQMSADECTQRFIKIINLEHKKTLLQLELNNKKTKFEELFGEFKLG